MSFETAPPKSPTSLAITLGLKLEDLDLFEAGDVPHQDVHDPRRGDFFNGCRKRCRGRGHGRCLKSKGATIKK